MGNSEKWQTRTTSSQVSVDKLGYESPRTEQETVVCEFFLSGKDVFAALPTGYGKLLCYACLPYAFDIALFPGLRPASRRLQYGKQREAGRGPGNEATFNNREANKDGHDSYNYVHHS